MNFLYKLYEFQYFFLKKQYKKSEIRELFLHVSITFSMLIFMPIWTLILTVNWIEKLFPNFYSLDALEKKIAILPLTLILFFIFNRLIIKDKKFHKRVYKSDLCGKSFSDYSKSYKIKMFIIMILTYLSPGYLPIIFYEMGIG